VRYYIGVTTGCTRVVYCCMVVVQCFTAAVQYCMDMGID
jgi:hypothetical protein